VPAYIQGSVSLARISGTLARWAGALELRSDRPAAHTPARHAIGRACVLREKTRRSQELIAFDLNKPGEEVTGFYGRARAFLDRIGIFVQEKP
jgi:hypothetical protein